MAKFIPFKPKFKSSISSIISPSLPKKLGIHTTNKIRSRSPRASKMKVKY